MPLERSLSPEAKYQHHLRLSRSGSGAFGSPQHWLRRTKSGKEAVAAQSLLDEEEPMESQPTLRPAETLTDLDNPLKILQAEVQRVEDLAGAAPPDAPRPSRTGGTGGGGLKRSQSSSALDTRREAKGSQGARPPALKLGKLPDSRTNGPRSARVPRVLSSRGERVPSKEPFSARVRGSYVGYGGYRGSVVSNGRAPERLRPEPRNLRSALKGVQAAARLKRASSAAPKTPKAPEAGAVPLLLQKGREAGSAAPPLRRCPSAPPRPSRAKKVEMAAA
ncbi:unnamed protein product [Durusdinium trenchii]|uniref:Uncharacterized protein n=4 Tax=Durusdinium trenchii TaxID=1381693 RepID=A0ABP0J6C8_9DINO